MANSIEISILLEVQKALKESNKFQREISDNLKKVESSAAKTNAAIGKFGDSFAKLGTSLVAFAGSFVALSKVTGFLKDSVEAASEAEASFNRLSLALTGTGLRDATTEIDKFIVGLSQTTGISDEAIRSTTAYIQTLAKLDKEGLKNATTAAVDLSAALGVDLNTASQLVAKAANGNVTALKRYGIAAKQGANDSETFANALRAIEGVAGGRAEAQAISFAGAVNKLTNAFGEFQESVGRIITENPIVIALLTNLASAFTDVGDEVEANRAQVDGFISDVTKFLAQLVPLIFEGIGAIVEITQFVVKAFQLAGAGFAAIVEQIFGLLEKIASTGIAKKLGLGELENTFRELKEVQRGVQDDIFNNIEASDKFFDSVGRGNEFLVNTSKKYLGTLDETAKAQRVIKRESEERFASQIKATKEASDAELKSIEEVNKKLKERAAALSSGDFSKIGGALTGEISFELGRDLPELAAGIGNALQKGISDGAKTAKDLFNGLVDIAAEALGPLGKAVAPFIKVLAEGPEQVRKFFKEFFQAIPEIVKNLFLSIGPLIESLLLGAIDLVLTLFENIDDIIIGMVEGLTNAILTILERAPEFITRIIEGIPELIQNLVEKIPEIINGFVEALPQLITAIVAKLPELIQAMITLLPQLFYAIAANFIPMMIDAAINFVQALIKEIPKIVSSIGSALTGKGGGGLGDAAKSGKLGFAGAAIGGGLAGIKKIGKVLGFQKGGLVPGGGPFTDRVPALLTPGEFVVDRTDTRALVNFLDREKTGQKQEELLGRIEKLLGQGQGSQPVTINLVLGEEQLANANLNLERRGFRTA